MLLADLSVMAEVRALASRIDAITERIDLLINNAGGIPSDRRVTPDGFEECFAGNHLGPFLLTGELLLAIARAGAGAQIINISSVGHRFIRDMQWDDLQMERKFDPGKAYSQSKLANILFAKGLARRLSGAGVRVNAVHPALSKATFPPMAMLWCVYSIAWPVVGSL